MGMYTELHFNTELKEDTPKEVIDILKYMVSDNPPDKPPKLPKHELFETPRWEIMLRCDSYYFDADTHSTLRFDDIGGSHYLCIRTNLKNYDSEIEKFIDWIDPYSDSYIGDFMGFYRYEETEDPTIIKKK